MKIKHLALAVAIGATLVGTTVSRSYAHGWLDFENRSNYRLYIYGIHERDWDRWHDDQWHSWNALGEVGPHQIGHFKLEDGQWKVVAHAEGGPVESVRVFRMWNNEHVFDRFGNGWSYMKSLLTGFFSAQ